MEESLTIWLTYHDDNQIEQYGLKEDESIRLFKGNDVDVEGENINHLTRFYSELCTMYYVWKNRIESRQIGFCHYRRPFNNVFEVDEGQCQVLSINHGSPIFQHYKLAHNYQDMYDAIEIIDELYGHGNPYSNYLLNGRVFIPCCCFIMNYSDFEKLCEWLFPILFACSRAMNRRLCRTQRSI